MSFLTGLLGGAGLKIAGILAAIGLVAAVLLGARQAGKTAERVETMKRTLEIKNAQQKAAAAAPRDRDELVDQLRRAGF